MAATVVTLNDLEGHSSVAGLFKYNPSNICAALYTISTDSVLARFLCISRASCVTNRYVLLAPALQIARQIKPGWNSIRFTQLNGFEWIIFSFSEDTSWVIGRGGFGQGCDKRSVLLCDRNRTDTKPHTRSFSAPKPIP